MRGFGLSPAGRRARVGIARGSGFAGLSGAGGTAFDVNQEGNEGDFSGTYGAGPAEGELSPGLSGTGHAVSPQLLTALAIPPPDLPPPPPTILDIKDLFDLLNLERIEEEAPRQPDPEPPPPEENEEEDEPDLGEDGDGEDGDDGEE